MKKILLPILATLCLCGCAPKGGENINNPDNNQDVGGGVGGIDNEEQKEPTMYSQKIDFTGATFASKFPAGTGFTTDKKVVELSNYVDTFLEHENLYASITIGNLHTQAWNENVFLQFGSGSNAIGSFQIVTFESPLIYKVEVEVLNYIKVNTYQGFKSIDSWSHFLIDEDEYNMEYDGQTDPEVHTYSKEYKDGTEEVNFSSLYGRVYMKSMTITWGIEDGIN